MTGYLRARATGRRVADFNTLNDLLEHARGEGATHYLQIDDETHLYFKRRDGRYEKSEAWQKDGYWHTQAPGSRAVVARPPSSARPIGGNATRTVRDYEAVDNRDRHIAGPFKSYGDARQAAGTAGVVKFVPSRGKAGRATEAREASRSAHHPIVKEAGDGADQWMVRYVHKISPSDKDVMGPVTIPDNAWSNSKTLGAALRRVKVLGSGASVRSFRTEGDKVVVFPSMPGSTTYWHSIILTHY